MTGTLPSSTRPLRLVIFDLMNTVLRFHQGTRKRVIGQIYRDIGRIDESVSDETIWQTIAKFRRRFTAIKGDDEFWRIVNTLVYEELCPPREAQHARSRAKRTHDAILGEASYYHVPKGMTQLIEGLKDAGVRVVIGSNQRVVSLEQLLQTFDLHGLFEEIYVSEALKERKPHPEFWQKILEAEDCDSTEVVHIGNSANSDSGAAALGIPVLLIDPNHELDCLREDDWSPLGLAEQDEEMLRDLVASDLISIAHRIDDADSWLQDRLKAA